LKQAQQSVDIAYLMGGEVLSSRRLSPRGEWRAAASTFASVAALSIAAGGVVALALMAAHRIVYGTAYLALWLLVGAGAASLAAFRARQRARRYTVGASINDDAFAGAPAALVRRTRGGYRVRIAQGFTGQIRGGVRTALHVDGDTAAEATDVALAPGTEVELRLGAATFIIRSLASDGAERGAAPGLPPGAARRFVRQAFLPLELAALASVLCAVPVGAQICEADMKSAIPQNASPWEIEKFLRSEAQTQARSLHQCFDSMPISCQRSGYVGVGLSLTREGEIRSHWIARSTYGADCPVDQCMSDIVAGWFFEPLPESMKVILPVQVLRTDRPLPYGAARAAADVERQKARSGIN
jgi:hypothetical protein